VVGTSQARSSMKLAMILLALIAVTGTAASANDVPASSGLFDVVNSLIPA
jgi:hypothetical protein